MTGLYQNLRAFDNLALGIATYFLARSDLE